MLGYIGYRVSRLLSKIPALFIRLCSTCNLFVYVEYSVTLQFPERPDCYELQVVLLLHLIYIYFNVISTYVVYNNSVFN